MPELPEVESIRRQLEPVLVGRRFDRVRIDDRRLVRPYEPAEVEAELQGERVAEVGRRGKYLVVWFESGRVLLIHLRMTGSLLHAPGGSLVQDPHRRAVVTLEDGSDVAYRDVRRFRTSLKAALLDQRTLAGLGNIYVDEALWRARLSPRRPAAGLDRNELRRLHRGIRAALQHGLDRQGSTLRDYRLPDGSGGAMQDEFRVYGRRDEPCDRCGTPIARTQVAGRTTWFCPTCQPENLPQAASSSSSRPSRSRRQSSV
jgi:formamidopyrimidine-DNA glycosylase